MSTNTPAPSDTARLDWLQQHARFVGLDDGNIVKTSDIRASIDAAMGPSPLRVEIRKPDGSDWLRFFENDMYAVDLGDFVGPGFTQRCIRATDVDVPLTVYFRPDRDGKRDEVVFELGRCWGEANRKAANLGPYTATIYRGDTVLATVSVPRHDWFSRWRWQSAPRAATGVLLDWIEEFDALPDFDPELLKASPAPKAVAIYEGPGDNAGVLKHMPDTSDRGDIGPITEYQARYLATGEPQSLASLLAQGEAGAGSVPWCLRDEFVGSVPDVREKWTSWSDKQPGPTRWIGRVLPKEPVKDSGDWMIDVGHQPPLCYVPYLLTGDPYLLEGLQFQANWNIGIDASRRVQEGLNIVNDGMCRSYAWGLRTLAQAALVTPETTPSWLRPKSYWKGLLDENLTYFLRRHVNGTTPIQTVLHAWYVGEGGGPNVKKFSAWQFDFLVFVLGWIVRMGFEEWRPCFEWALENTLIRTGSHPDWDKRYSTPYLWDLFRPDGTPYDNIAEWFATMLKDPSCGAMAPAPAGDQFALKYYWGYQEYTRAALVMALSLGYEKARSGYEWCRRMTMTGLKQGRKIPGVRWAFEEDGRITA